MRYFPSLLVAVMALAVGIGAQAQTPDYGNVGRTATQEEIQALDTAVSPEGKGLPPGHGTAPEGAKIFAQKCAVCHGPNLEGGKNGPALTGGNGTLTTLHPVKSIGSFWPYATSLWDHINRAMPLYKPGSLTANEVYALTAFLLYRNGIVRESEVLDAKSLPKIQMPNHDGFVPSRIEDIRRWRCPGGHCP